MPSEIESIFARGEIVDVHLLTEIPASTDQELWQEPAFAGYRPQKSAIQVIASDLPSGIAWQVEAMWTATSGGWYIAAIGLTYKGSVLCVAIVENPNNLQAYAPVNVRVAGLMNPVQV